MQKLIQLLIALSMIIGTAELNAQTKNKLNNHQARFLQKDIEEFGSNPGRTASPNFQNTATYVPINEVDSSYDPGTSTWFYTRDVLHTYCQSNCMDSVVTFTYNGSILFRETHQYDLQNNETYLLTENWNGVAWENTSLDLTSYYSNSCYLMHIYNLEWNGTNWDTISGYRNLINFDSYNNPIQRISQSYDNGTWVNGTQNNYSFDVNNQFLGFERSIWDVPSNQFVLQYRFLNYVFYYYNNYCDAALQSYEEQTWDGSNWQNAYSLFLTNGSTYDTSFTFTWNGNSYDSTSKTITGVDSYGNNLGYIEFSYNQSTQSWDTTDANQYILTYGPNNEVIRIENINDWYSTPDSIFPNNVAVFSNFFICNSTLAVDDILFTPNFKVYPNPAFDILHVEISNNANSENFEFSIVDITGKTIKQISSIRSVDEVDLKNIVPGIYFYQVRDNKSILKNGKIIIE